MSALRTSDDRAGGSDQLLLSIGGLVGRLVLGAGTRTFLHELRERYHAFSLPPARGVGHAFSLALRFRDAGRMPERRADPPARPLVVQADAETVNLDRWDFAVHLQRLGSSPGAFAGHGSCEMNPFAFDSLVRILWSVFLPRAGGALFHACGLRHQDTGLLAPGLSGAGKTTLARKVPDPDDVLGDEIVAVHPDGQGLWRVSGTPFWGEFGRGGRSQRSFPLTGIAFLEQTAEAHVRIVSPAEGLLRALSCLICFERDGEAVVRNLALATALCAGVPTMLLGTRLDSSLADVLALLRPHLLQPPAERRAPLTPREMISELRARLRDHPGYAFRPRGGSMHPALRSGDALFISRVRAEQVRTGEVLLYWRPGRRPQDDRLTCHRLLARLRGGRILVKGDAVPHIERFEDQREAEILGRVEARARDGVTTTSPGRTASLALLLGSLVRLPIARMRRALRW